MGLKCLSIKTNADLFPLFHIVVCCSESNKQIACFHGLTHSPAESEQAVAGMGRPPQERFQICTQQRNPSWPQE